MPRLLDFFWFLCNTGTNPITRAEKNVINSAGLKEGCLVASLAFILAIKILYKGIVEKMFFNDDAF